MDLTLIVVAIALVVLGVLVLALRRLNRPTASSILARLYAGERIMVAPTTGTETLAGAGDLFTGYLDADFRNWGTNVPGKPTPATEVAVYEMRKDADFRTMFGSLGKAEALCLSQGQIIDFVRKHRNKLHPEGWATFFLFKVGNEFFVAFVGAYGDGLEAYVSRFDYALVWYADFRLRVVVPQLNG